MLTMAPMYVSWNYTYACNFDCMHCYSRDSAYPRELDTTAYHRIADQFIDAQVLRVGLGGGEPLIRRDCIEILRHMGEGHIDTNITTNAWFLTAERCEQLANARLGTLYISLDSSDASQHDSFRRREGSFQRVMDGMRAAVAAGLLVKLSTVITSLNFLQITSITRLAEEIGIAGIEFKRFRPTGNGQQSQDVLALAPEQEVEVQPLLAALDGASDLDIALFYNDEPDGGIDSGCPCGIRSLTLRPNGDVSPCAYAGHVIGNLTVDDIGELWRDSPALATMRSGGSCAGLVPAPSPSGVSLTQRRVKA